MLNLALGILGYYQIGERERAVQVGPYLALWAIGCGWIVHIWAAFDGYHLARKKLDEASGLGPPPGPRDPRF